MNDKTMNLVNIIESVNAIVWEYNIITDRWDYVSPQTKPILGFHPEEWINLDFWVNNVHEEDRGWATEYCLNATSKGEDHIFEYRFMKKNGGYIWLRDEVVVIMEQDKPIKLRGFMTNITELKEREEHIRFMSFHDELTSLYNRRFFDEELARLNHERFLPLTIIMGDVNDLKLVNDTYGHIVGDNYLKLAASIIQSESRATDIVARWGGDEFVILMPNTNASAAQKLVSRIQKKIEVSEFKQGKLSIAFGYATKTKNKQDIQTTFKLAEKTMYQNKK